MKKAIITYVVLIPKAKWESYETALDITGQYSSVDIVKQSLPVGSTIMPEYDFFRYLNMGGINTTANWVVRVAVTEAR